MYHNFVKSFFGNYKLNIFVDVTYCIKISSAMFLHYTEDGVSIFLQNVGSEVPNFMVSHF
jgi:hypothetical protein